MGCVAFTWRSVALRGAESRGSQRHGAGHPLVLREQDVQEAAGGERCLERRLSWSPSDGIRPMRMHRCATSCCRAAGQMRAPRHCRRSCGTASRCICSSSTRRSSLLTTLWHLLLALHHPMAPARGHALSSSPPSVALSAHHAGESLDVYGRYYTLEELQQRAFEYVLQARLP
jgi:hypothetical protein